MSRPLKYTQDQLMRAKELRAQGFTYAEIADTTGMTKSAIVYHLDPNRKILVRISQKRYYEAHREEIQKQRIGYLKKYRAQKYGTHA